MNEARLNARFASSVSRCMVHDEKLDESDQHQPPTPPLLHVRVCT